MIPKSDSKTEWFGEKQIFRFYNHYSPNMTYEIIANTYDEALVKLKEILGSAAEQMAIEHFNFSIEPYFADGVKKTSAIGFHVDKKEKDETSDRL